MARIAHLLGISLLLALPGAWVAQAQSAAAGRGAAAASAAMPSAATPAAGQSASVAPDGNQHLVYEVWLNNFSSGAIDVEQVEVVDGQRIVARLDAAAVASRLQAAGRRDASATMAPSTQALLFLHLTLPADAPLPVRLEHRIRSRVAAAPPGRQQITETGAAVAPDRRPVVVIGPPLAGDGHIAADSCCDATRHTRAALPIDGKVWLAQRYAVDWERLDAQRHIYTGPRADPRSYAIYAQPVLAVADARVASISDGLPEQTPGHYPEAIAPAEADGNAIVLDLGGGNYALYAHLQPGSLMVHVGDTVQRGQVLARVGNSGNSVAPHLHFQVMDSASSLAANGLPYQIDRYSVTGTTPGTEAFDAAEADGTPLAITPLRRPVRDALPLDQQIIDFPVP